MLRAFTQRFLLESAIELSVAFYGLLCVITAHGHLLVAERRRFYFREVDGVEAMATGGCYLAFAAFVNLSTAWRRDERLRAYARRGQILSALALVACSLAVWQLR